jgi:hypothetical protein
MQGSVMSSMFVLLEEELKVTLQDRAEKEQRDVVVMA